MIMKEVICRTRPTLLVKESFNTLEITKYSMAEFINCETTIFIINESTSFDRVGCFSPSVNYMINVDKPLFTNITIRTTTNTSEYRNREDAKLSGSGVAFCVVIFNNSNDPMNKNANISTISKIIYEQIMSFVL